MKNNCQSQLISQAIAILTLTNVFFLVFSQAALSNSINLTGTLRDFRVNILTLNAKMDKIDFIMV